MIPASRILLVNDIVQYDLFGTVANRIHPPHPTELIAPLHRFVNTLVLCHLIHKLREHFFRLLVDAGKA